MEKQELDRSDFRSLTSKELRSSIELLGRFKKYSFYDLDFIWGFAIQEYFKGKEEDKKKFEEEQNKSREDRSSWFSTEKEKVLKLYQYLCDNHEKTPEEEKFDREGMPAEDRFNPEWYKACVKKYTEELQKMGKIGDLIAVYDISGDEFIHGDSQENIKDRLTGLGFSEEEIGNYIENIKSRIVEYSKTQHGSLCYTPYINGKPVSAIFLSPYRNKVDTLQTMWHETTHFIQKKDERFSKELIPIREEESNLEYKFKTKEINEEEYAEQRQKLDLDNIDKKIRLLAEIQANLNGSMIVLLQAIRDGLNDVELDKVQRSLILTANSDYKGGYCDFILTRDNLDKLRQDKSFRDLFLKDGNIDYNSLYEYTYSESLRQRDKILDFAEQEGVSLKELEERKDLLEKENSPVLKLRKAQNEYFQKNPLTEQEKIEMEMHEYRSWEERTTFYHSRLVRNIERFIEEQKTKETEKRQKLFERLKEAQLHTNRARQWPETEQTLVALG